MAEILPLKASEHDKVLELLPWFVTGTLSADETDRVESHLEGCAECREALAFERQLAEGVATLPLNVNDGWKAMSRRLVDEPPARTSEGGNVHFLRRPVPVGWAGAGALAAAAAVAVFFALPSGAPQPADQTFHTLSAPRNATPGQLVVLFKPDTTEQQVRVILSSHNARVVDGPTAAGAYVLHVEGTPARALDALRQSSQVVLAEPIEGAPGR
jgi:hypothetical protein